ncbi:MAG TPA: ABC transporter permease subunit, partial [Anaerolineales bacterium]|nr:ABC transporter permease subunit [Anaerolineales bacterium]
MLNNLRPALVVARREVRDQFRDWRIIGPVFLLAIIFPSVMNYAAGQLIQLAQRYGARVELEQLVPFLLMVVGFFPVTVSLVIALESFVGEKERRSIEPLLTTPLSDLQLYLGKLLAAMVPPLLASYLGM